MSHVGNKWFDAGHGIFPPSVSRQPGNNFIVHIFRFSRRKITVNVVVYAKLDGAELGYIAQC